MKLIKFLAFSLFFSFSVFPQANANEVLSQLQQKFNTVSDLAADFKQSGSSSEIKGGLSGKFFYKKKDQFRIELKSLTIACDGKVTWNYNIKAKKYIVNNFDSNDPANLSLNRFVYDYPPKCKVSLAGTEKIGSGECVIIELVPKKGELNFKKARLWKDESNLIRKISVDDTNGTNFTVELSNVKLNQKLPDSKFTMVPPEGSKVIDLR